MEPYIPELLEGFGVDGYLDRAGNFYRCGYQAHRRFAPKLHAQLFPEQPLPASIPQSLYTPEEEAEFAQLYPNKTIPMYLNTTGLQDEAEDFFRDEGWVKISSGRVVYFAGETGWRARHPEAANADYPYRGMSVRQIELIVAWYEATQPRYFEYNGQECSIEQFLRRQHQDATY